MLRNLVVVFLEKLGSYEILVYIFKILPYFGEQEVVGYPNAMATGNGE